MGTMTMLERTSDYSTKLAALLREQNALADRSRAATSRDERLSYRLADRALHAQQRQLTCAAAEAFAHCNGWRFVIDKTFSVKTLARGGVHDGYYQARMYDIRLFDHPLYFRERVRPYRTAAIVGQPYNTSPETARAGAAALGLTCHVPPNPTASWWYPGSTRFFCFTRLQIERVQFLPEQLEKPETAGMDQ